MIPKQPHAFMPQILRNLWGGISGKRGKLPNAERPCIVCKTPHRHTQPFCTAQCCQDHRDAQKLPEPDRSAYLATLVKPQPDFAKGGASS